MIFFRHSRRAVLAAHTQPSLAAPARLLSHLRTVLIALCAAVGLLAALPASAQSNWPKQPITFVLGYPPGGGTDAVARLLSDRMGKLLGQSVIIENRPGVGGLVAGNTVLRAKPDGYTLFFITSAAVAGAIISIKDMPYDPLKDFVPVTLIAHGPYLLVGSPSFPPNNLRELVAYAKANPGKVNVGSAGTSTADYFYLEMLKMDADIDVVHVPYKGASVQLNDTISGVIQYSMDTPGTSGPLIKAGKLKALALLDTHRAASLPNVPTATEQGYPNLVGGSWYGLLAPPNTPPEIVNKIYDAVATTLKTPEMSAGLAKRDVVPDGLAPAAFKKYLTDETNKFVTLAHKLGIKPM